MASLDALMQLADSADGGSGSQALMNASEAERLIEGLFPLSVQDMGTARWTAQDQSIQRLNLQAHHNAQQHAEEFVVELLVSLDKMQVLVQNLLAIEAWKEKVLPHLHRHLARNVDKVVTYMVLYHEVNLANLLEVTLYHSHAVEALPEEHLLELADWCYRKLLYLNAPQGGRRVAAYKHMSAAQLMNISPEEELDAKVDETDFGAAMCSLSILRYLTDGLNTLPMGLLSRVVATNDTLMALVPLLDQPPWVRRRPNGVFEKWNNSQWQAIEAVDRFKLSQLDAQLWLAINNLVVEPKARAKYGFDEWRRDRLLTLKRFMNELLFDQMPVLKDLQRVLDEMALGVGSDAAASRNAALILETVPGIRDSLLAVQDWRALALSQAQGQFSPNATKQTARSMYESLSKAFDFMADLEGLGASSSSQSNEAKGGSVKSFGPGPVRLSSWRKVHESGVMEAWSDYTFELDPSKPPEPVSLEHLQGLRYRLVPMDIDSTRPLPISGKAVVRCNGDTSPGPNSAPTQEPASAPETLMAEALISLPEVALRSKAGEQPPVVWVTIGLLAVEGLALQLKLKRADKPRERDKVLGVWCAYHPVGGALTVLRSGQTIAKHSAATAANGNAAPSSQQQQQQQQPATAASSHAQQRPQPEQQGQGASHQTGKSPVSVEQRQGLSSQQQQQQQQQLQLQQEQGASHQGVGVASSLKDGVSPQNACPSQQQARAEQAGLEGLHLNERSECVGGASVEGQGAGEGEDALDLPD